MSSDTREVAADGSAVTDRRETVRIDRSIPAERWRYICPEGHTDWFPTNNHVWCKGCRRAIEAGHDDLDAEYYEIVDKQSGEAIPWSAIELVAPEEVARD